MKTFLAILFIMLFPLSALAGETIRVLLKDDQQRLEVKVDGEVICYDGQGNLMEMHLDEAMLELETIDGALHINGIPVPRPPLKIKAIAGQMGVNGIRLQSELEIRKKPGGLVQAIALLDMEEYLKGVVPAEASPKWELEVLKAQAVAARTYALYKKKSQAGGDYDVTADVNSQVYSGNGLRSPISDRAVDETAGLVLTYDGKLINAMFHGCCGGETEDVGAVFGKPVEYLKSVEGMCPPHGSKMQWEKWFSASEIQDALERKGYRIGKVRDIRVAAQSDSDRVTRLVITHSKGELSMKGNDFRKAMGWEVVPSTRFAVKKTKGGRYRFEGKGSGHGVGLCQLGAREMGLQGKNFEEILLHYYTDVKIEPYRPDM
ncbi:MAG: SpoIID/LytB domain-containing protein [Nitrospirota bacterium]|nr:SpoIID/LytB domain-containing protein [Nitrospirota bacterium]